MAQKKEKLAGNYDEFDLLILRELRDDCKASIRQLSDKVGMHPNTLMQRIKRLEEDKVIVKYAAEIDYAKLGYDLHAVIFLKVDKKTREEWQTLEKLRSIPDLLALYAITGTYDVMGIAKTKDRESLTKLIREINKNDFVIESNTTFVLYPFKHSYEFNPFKW
jgi:DNA-binding Lrp family transcriptional regulator